MMECKWTKDLQKHLEIVSNYNIKIEGLQIQYILLGNWVWAYTF